VGKGSQRKLGLVTLGIFVVIAGALLAHRFHVTRQASETPKLAPMVLNGYDRPPPNIGNAKVQDLNRDNIGTVIKVEVGRTGKPVALRVLLSKTRQAIIVMASNASYDEQHNIVTIGFDRNQIEQMARRP
jgi:hypothetical protein